MHLEAIIPIRSLWLNQLSEEFNLHFVLGHNTYTFSMFLRNLNKLLSLLLFLLDQVFLKKNLLYYLFSCSVVTSSHLIGNKDFGDTLSAQLKLSSNHVGKIKPQLTLKMMSSDDSVTPGSELRLFKKSLNCGCLFNRTGSDSCQGKVQWTVNLPQGFSANVSTPHAPNESHLS